MKKNNYKIKTKEIELKTCFIICTAISLFLTLAVLYISHGNGFSKIFFHDSLDTGMDFFHSIEYTKGRVPYKKFSTLYPPLANLCFYALYLLIPFWQCDSWAETFEDGIAVRGTDIDMRIWQPTLLIFILFIMITSCCLFMLLQRVLDSKQTSNLFAIACMFSYGVLYAFERGNIIIIAFACCLFFLIYYESENKITKEISLIMLAVAAGLKLYPALFGIILLYNKHYKEAIRTIMYGVICFIFPFFAFREKLSGMRIFFNTLFNFSEKGNDLVTGFSFDKILLYSSDANFSKGIMKIFFALDSGA